MHGTWYCLVHLSFRLLRSSLAIPDGAVAAAGVAVVLIIEVVVELILFLVVHFRFT